MIDNHAISDGHPAYIIAEMACAHEGELDVAHCLVDIAADARADAVQLQLFSVRCLISPCHLNYQDALRLEIPLSEWPNIIAHAKQRGLHVWTTVSDEEALEVAMRADVDALKLHSSDLSNQRMLDAVGGTGKMVSLAVGGSTLDEISQAVWRLRERGTTDLILMHGYQGYPTAPQDSHLGFIETLRRLFNCPVGYQDHTDGASELAVILPLVAIGMGACVLEKHYTDDRARRGTDYEAALDPEDFTRFVRLVRDVDAAIAEGAVQPMSVEELKYRRAMKKTIVAAHPITKGETVTEDMLAFMRAGAGLMPAEVTRIIGRQSRHDIPQFATITSADLLPVAEESNGLVEEA